MKKKTYPAEFKKEVVQYYERNHTISETRTKYGIAESTLFEWKKQYDQAHYIYVPGPGPRKKHKDLQAHLAKVEQMMQVLNRCPCGIFASIEEKIAAIEELEGEYSVHVLCEALRLPRGTYYNRKRRKGQLTSFEQSDIELQPIIERLFHENKDLLGRKPLQKKLRDIGIIASEKRISRIMKESGLFVSKPRYQAEHLKPIPNPHYRNHLNRQFDQTAPNLVWVSDVTYVKVGAQYYFVCVVLDLFSRRVLAYGISDTNDTTLVMETFLSAYSSRNCPSGLMFHSDRGAPYTSYVFRELLREHHVRQSFSKPGEPYDNAVCESFFHTLKREAIYHYLYATPNDLRITLDSYVKFYNEERPHRALNMLTPKEKEAEFMIQQ